jgi:predicted amidohydrolase
MNVGFVQFSPSFGEKHKNFETVKKLLDGITADVLVLPELFNTGYLFLNRGELATLAEARDGETANFMQSLAKKKTCAFAYGFAEKDNEFFYNSMAFMTADGIVALYRKSHLFFEEKKFFHAGDTGFQVFQYRNVTWGMLICIDWIFPEAMRTLAMKGAQVVLQPANLVMPYCPDAMVTRALENRVFVVLADRTGADKRNNKELRFIGTSEIVAPNGDILIRAGEEECIKVVEIDPASSLNKKINEYNDLFIDRREDLYFK